MKCQCSLNSDYKVIGMCDIDDFNSKISGFKENSWNQITISNLLKIEDNRANIKEIKEFKVEIKINNIKITNTSISTKKNNEGFKLTGKIILVYGELKEKIFYTGEDNKLNSIKFNNTFNAKIAIDESANIDDIYEVYPCIEDVSAYPLDSRTISRNIRLFLFAHQVEIDLPSEIINTFIFKNFRNEEIVTLSFKSHTKKLNATSTGFEFQAGTTKPVFQVELLNSDGTTLKERGIVNSNSNGDDFVNSLNDKKFKYGDILRVTFIEHQYTTLTNYPNEGENYKMLTLQTQSFKITEDGIIPNILPNTVMLNDVTNLPVLILNFDKLTKNMLLQYTDKITNPAYIGQDYFTVLLRGSSFRAVSIQGGDTGIVIANRLFGQSFQYGDTLTLDYEENNKILITNFPNQGSPNYNPSGKSETYEITDQGLIKQ